MRDAEAKQKLEEEAFLAWDESLSEEEKGRIEKLAGGPETTLPPIRVQKRRKYWEEKVRGAS